MRSRLSPVFEQKPPPKPMSPLPNQSPNPPSAAVPEEPILDKQSTSDENQGTLMSTDATSETGHVSPESSAADSPTPKRPLMRPVSRPNPPPVAPTPVPPPPVAHTPIAPPVRPVAPAPPQPKAEVVAVVPATAVVDTTISSRQQPIPPPSEPKQYRAIGLVRGRYTSSEEQFTRGEMLTSDGTPVEAVLLGRVMSLVKNHLDLNEEHLWVVYPRTREIEQDLHLQIVGVWEPEKLQKPEDEAGETEAVTNEPDLSPGYEDDYFSIRGEVVFYAPEQKKVVVKIQQAPRKAADKAKAFKLQLEGVLETEKAVGYFWDFQVNRTGKSLAIAGATSIGLVPPKKRPPGGFTKGPRRFSAGGAGGARRFGPPRDGGRDGARDGAPRPTGGAPVRRETGANAGTSAGATGSPKPVKRTAPKPEEQPAD